MGERTLVGHDPVLVRTRVVAKVDGASLGIDDCAPLARPVGGHFGAQPLVVTLQHADPLGDERVNAAHLGLGFGFGLR